MTKPIFYEGQQVGCLMYGEGIVRTFGYGKLRVELDQFVFEYHTDGRISVVARPTLYPIEQYRAIIATLPAPEPEKWQPKPGEWCWFWDNSVVNDVALRKFSTYHDDFIYRDELGCTWKCCAPFTGELPDHLKEVHP